MYDYAGPSIIEMIEDERDKAEGSYRHGLDIALDTINGANKKDERPIQWLKSELANAKTTGGTEGEIRGIETALHIFTHTYDWYFNHYQGA